MVGVTKKEVSQMTKYYLKMDNIMKNAKHHTSCMPTHVLFKYGKIGNESKDAAVPHGAFRYIGYNECVHTYRIR